MEDGYTYEEPRWSPRPILCAAMLPVVAKRNAHGLLVTMPVAGNQLVWKPSGDKRTNFPGAIDYQQSPRGLWDATTFKTATKQVTLQKHPVYGTATVQKRTMTWRLQLCASLVDTTTGGAIVRPVDWTTPWMPLRSIQDKSTPSEFKQFTDTLVLGPAAQFGDEKTPTYWGTAHDASHGIHRVQASIPVTDAMFHFKQQAAISLNVASEALGDITEAPNHNLVSLEDNGEDFTSYVDLPEYKGELGYKTLFVKNQHGGMLSPEDVEPMASQLKRELTTYDKGSARVRVCKDPFLVAATGRWFYEIYASVTFPPNSLSLSVEQASMSTEIKFGHKLVFRPNTLYLCPADEMGSVTPVKPSPPRALKPLIHAYAEEVEDWEGVWTTYQTNRKKAKPKTKARKKRPTAITTSSASTPAPKAPPKRKRTSLAEEARKQQRVQDVMDNPPTLLTPRAPSSDSDSESSDPQ